MLTPKRTPSCVSSEKSHLSAGVGWGVEFGEKSMNRARSVSILLWGGLTFTWHSFILTLLSSHIPACSSVHKLIFSPTHSHKCPHCFKYPAQPMHVMSSYSIFSLCLVITPFRTLSSASPGWAKCLALLTSCLQWGLNHGAGILMHLFSTRLVVSNIFVRIH